MAANESTPPRWLRLLNPRPETLDRLFFIGGGGKDRVARRWHGHVTLAGPPQNAV